MVPIVQNFSHLPSFCTARCSAYSSSSKAAKVQARLVSVTTALRGMRTPASFSRSRKASRPFRSSPHSTRRGVGRAGVQTALLCPRQAAEGGHRAAQVLFLHGAQAHPGSGADFVQCAVFRHFPGQRRGRRQSGDVCFHVCKTSQKARRAFLRLVRAPAHDLLFKYYTIRG